MARPKDSGIDDSGRLERVGDLMLADGIAKTEAARQVLTQEFGADYSYLSISIARLLRKIRESGGEANLLKEAKRRAAVESGNPLRIEKPTREQWREHGREVARRTVKFYRKIKNYTVAWQEFSEECARRGEDPGKFEPEMIGEILKELFKGPRE